jgi:hypothetical protein
VPPNKMGAPGAIIVTSDVGRELLRDMHPERKLLQRTLPPGFRRVTKDDVTAARLLIHYCNLALLPSLTEWSRFRPNRDDGTRTPDWRIVQLMLDERLSTRKVATRLGLDHSGVSKRFKAAIATISEQVGPLERLFPQKGTVVHRVGRIGKPTFQPLPRPKWPETDADWLREAVQQFGEPTRCPSGCAEGYPERGKGRFISRSSVVNDDDDQAAPVHKGALNTEGQYSKLPPRAFDWRKLTGELRDGEFKNSVLVRENAVADLLADKNWPPKPYWPNSDEVSRFSIGWFNDGLPCNRAPQPGETFPIGWWSEDRSGRARLRPAQRICGIFNDGSVFWWPTGGAHLVPPAPRRYSTSIGCMNLCGPVIERTASCGPGLTAQTASLAAAPRSIITGLMQPPSSIAWVTVRMMSPLFPNNSGHNHVRTDTHETITNKTRDAHQRLSRPTRRARLRGTYD